MAEQLTTAELIKLAAIDDDFFARTFFPKTMRSPSPPFDKAVWAALNNPRYRLLNLRLFRGAAKTSKLRLFTAKRVAFGISRTILFVGASESHATRSVQWLRSQIEPRMGADGQLHQTLYATTFGLRPGKKWQEHEIEVYHGVDQHPIWIIGVGITGNIRGINFDDYRPDLIILDDPVTDENAATGPQREKVADLVMGALAQSLTPATEEPNAKLAMLQTPLDDDDVSGRAERSAEWHTEVFGCWTKETEDLSIEHQRSAWETRYPTAILQKQKRDALADNRYSIFAREMECKLVTSESAAFPRHWLKRYGAPPKAGMTVISIDPVPPPSDAQMAKNLKGKDFEAISVVRRSGGNYYLLDYALSRGHQPDWTASKFFEFISRYRAQSCVLSLVSAERYLKWYLEKEMSRRRVFIPLKEAVIGGKSKFARITAALAGVASAGKLYCDSLHHDFILQFEGYGLGFKGNDDLIESVANGVSELTNPYLELLADEYEEDDIIPKFEARRACP